MDKIVEVYTDQIDDPKDAMRSELDRDSLFELAENIKTNGLINPITIRPIGERYEVVAGHRRLSACKIAGKIKIPCVVRELDDNQTFEIMAAENLERADVDPVDEAIFIKTYIDKTNKSISEVARSLKRSVSYVQSRLAVGEMPEYMQQFLKTKELKINVALVLNQITDDEVRHMWTLQAVRDGVSVSMAEYWLADFKSRILPNGETPRDASGQIDFKPPEVVMFTCAIDGQKYDTRTLRSIVVYEGNLDIFNAFVSEFRKSPTDSEFQSGGD